MWRSKESIVKSMCRVLKMNTNSANTLYDLLCKDRDKKEIERIKNEVVYAKLFNLSIPSIASVSRAIRDEMYNIVLPRKKTDDKRRNFN